MLGVILFWDDARAHPDGLPIEHAIVDPTGVQFVVEGISLSNRPPGPVITGHRSEARGCSFANCALVLESITGTPSRIAKATEGAVILRTRRLGPCDRVQ